MARLSNISVVVPLPSFDINPLKKFDENFFDRAIDDILSEEASIEGSRDEMMDGDIDISSPFGNRRRENLREKEKHMTMEDNNSNDKAPVNPENVTRPQHENEVIKVQSCPIHEAGDHPSTLSGITESPALPIDDSERTVEDTIFDSVGLEKRIEVLKFIASRPFMIKPVQPVRRSDRREFNSQLRSVAAEAGLGDTAIDALIEHVRGVYLEELGIVAAEYAGSAFGDEVDGEEDTYTERSHRKRRNSSSGHTEDDEHKKNKRRHSDPAKPHSHDALQHDEPTKVLKSFEADALESVPTEIQDKVYVEPDELKRKNNTPDLPKMPTNFVLGSPSSPIDLTDDSSPYGEFVSQFKYVLLQKERVDAIGEFKDLDKSNEETLTRRLSLDAPKEDMHETRSPEKVVEIKPSKRRDSSKESKIERNRRKRERRKSRNKHYMKDDSAGGAEKQPEGHSADGAYKDRIPPSTPPQTSSESLNGSNASKRSSGQLPLPADPTLADNSRVGSKRKRETASSLYNLSIPPQTRKLLKDLNLPSDFLSSDSSLSDAPSDFDFDSDWDDLERHPLHIHINISPPKSPCLVPQCTNPEPETPVKCTSLVNPERVKTPQAKAPKHSPYFPPVLVNSESCLPFPPIDGSSFGLIQEQLAHDPFRLLIATIFLNRTRGGVALPVLFKVFERYPTIEAMAEADSPELVSMINCLGFQNQRARKCITLAQTWLSDPPDKRKRYRKLHYPRKLDGRNVGREECIDEDDLRVAWEIAHLPGVGAYSLDSWRIFCRDELRGKASDWKGTDATEVGFVPEWKCVLPQDKELRAYLTWMWLKEGWIWDYNTGDLTLASDKMMRAAQNGGVAHEEEGSWVLETSPVKAVNGLHESD
ncbi:DNA glycosylase [Penicillium psychrosexuale]|uniref:DNA glycosylase n=1 Tax=Penicillium psychrosexuale TaxID=1002107 RepID=UPI002544F860|nr:DNA glycosylase [Penicillium psychrosexuale]KAJ5804477.1 DNA glycosylase [Penicillium psychrosexuale]